MSVFEKVNMSEYPKPENPGFLFIYPHDVCEYLTSGSCTPEKKADDDGHESHSSIP